MPTLPLAEHELHDTEVEIHLHQLESLAALQHSCIHRRSNNSHR
jgi:hypothetical protein